MPTTSDPNPRNQCNAIEELSGACTQVREERCEAITLRNQKVVDLKVGESQNLIQEEERKKKQESDNRTDGVSELREDAQHTNRDADERRKTEERALEKGLKRVQRQELPYPGRFRKENEEKAFEKFLEMLRRIHINIPFVDAIIEIPQYAKFLKELLTRKRKVRSGELVLSANSATW